MKKFILLILVIVSCLLLAEEISVSNSAELQVINRDVSDMDGQSESQDDRYTYLSYKHYLQMNYKFFEVGAKFVGYFPRYDKFSLINEIGKEKDEFYFDEYYMKSSFDSGYLQLGKFSTSIGSGIILNAQYDDEFNTDSRIVGFDGEINEGDLTLRIFGGFSPWDKPEIDEAEFENDFLRYYNYEKDYVYGFDFMFPLLDGALINGLSYVFHNELTNFVKEDVSSTNSDIKDYQKNNILAYRTEINIGSYSSTSELAFNFINDYNGEKDKDDSGLAFLTNQSYYLENSSVSVQYKYLENFDSKIHDIPTLNYSEETVFDDNPGEQEQGVMIEATHNLSNGTELLVNYAEGWTNDNDYQLSNFFAEVTKHFSNSTLIVDYEQLEEKNETVWTKEMAPLMSYDFMIAENIPMTVKLKYGVQKEKNSALDITYYEPKIQTDIAYHNFGLSVIVDHKFGESKEGEDLDFGDSDHFWIGTELAYNLLNKADIRLFVGKEKEGKVCRNGVCKKQPEFSGIRLDITTSF